MRYATSGGAATALAIATSSLLLTTAPAEVEASPFPDPFDRRYADNVGIPDGLNAGNTRHNFAIRQAPTPPANLPNATGLSYAVPPPDSNGGKAWKDAHGRAREFVNQMTVKEKVRLYMFILPFVRLPFS